jgi:HMG-box domain
MNQRMSMPYQGVSVTSEALGIDASRLFQQQNEYQHQQQHHTGTTKNGLTLFGSSGVPIVGLPLLQEYESLAAFSANIAAVSAGKKRSWKKPSDKPKRPLSAYNIFFQLERERLVKEGISTDRDSVIPKYTAEDVQRACEKSANKGTGQQDDDDNVVDPVKAAEIAAAEAAKRKHRKTHGMIGFADLARTIAKGWKNLSAEDRVVFEERAAIEKESYRTVVEEWQEKQLKARDDKKKEGSVQLNNSTHSQTDVSTQLSLSTSKSMSNSNSSSNHNSHHSARSNGLTNSSHHTGSSHSHRSNTRILHSGSLPRLSSFASQHSHEADDQTTAEANQCINANFTEQQDQFYNMTNPSSQVKTYQTLTRTQLMLKKAAAATTNTARCNTMGFMSQQRDQGIDTDALNGLMMMGGGARGGGRRGYQRGSNRNNRTMMTHQRSNGIVMESDGGLTDTMLNGYNGQYNAPVNDDDDYHNDENHHNDDIYKVIQRSDQNFNTALKVFRPEQGGGMLSGSNHSTGTTSNYLGRPSSISMSNSSTLLHNQNPHLLRQMQQRYSKLLQQNELLQKQQQQQQLMQMQLAQQEQQMRRASTGMTMDFHSSRSNDIYQHHLLQQHQQRRRRQSTMKETGLISTGSDHSSCNGNNHVDITQTNVDCGATSVSFENSTIDSNSDHTMTVPELMQPQQTQFSLHKMARHKQTNIMNTLYGKPNPYIQSMIDNNHNNNDDPFPVVHDNDRTNDSSHGRTNDVQNTVEENECDYNYVGGYAEL